MMKLTLIFCILFFVFMSTSPASSTEVGVNPDPTSGVDADFVLTNGRVYTVNEKQPWAEAIAVKGNKLTFVGSSKGAERFIGDDTKVANLDGRLVLPGLIDSHLHAFLGAVAQSGVWVAEIPDVDGVLAAISKFAKAHPERDVIFGWGYDLSLFGPEGPSKELLDKAVPDRPAYIIRGDGHSAWANTKALALAGVDKNTPDPSPPKWMVKEPSSFGTAN